MLRLETNQLKSITNCGYVATIWVQQVYRVMRKEVRLLRAKGIDSLILSIELFNRPSDAGRMHAVLIFLDHALEMLFKAAIVHRGGRIRERRSKQTIGFDACVRRGLSDANVKFLGENQALTAQMVNSLRDAAQHHLLSISQGHLFIQAQAGTFSRMSSNKTCGCFCRKEFSRFRPRHHPTSPLYSRVKWLRSGNC
jgi:hypothetical protein